MLAGIDEVAAESGFDVLASFVGKRRSRPELVKRLLRQGRVDALLLLNLDDSTDLTPESVDRTADRPDRPRDQRLEPARRRHGQRRRRRGDDRAPFEQGHRRIAILTGPEGNYDSDQRLLGCRRAFARLGLTLRPELWSGAARSRWPAACARPAITSNPTQPLPDAIFCLNDAMAIGMLGELQRRGISVPGDVALAGYDNVEAAGHLSLTSVACPMRLMGQVAARWAVSLITQNERPRGSACRCAWSCAARRPEKHTTHSRTGAGVIPLWKRRFHHGPRHPRNPVTTLQ